MIENAVGRLLPHAAHNVGQPFETPLRWHESRMQGSAHPFSFALWANLDPGVDRRISITRTLPLSPESSVKVWSCSITEPAPPEEAQYASFSVTDVGVFTSNRSVVNRTLYRKVPERPDHYGACVGGEWNSELTDERRAELLGHVSNLLAQAIVQMPVDQVRFFSQMTVDRPPLSFEQGGSAMSKQTLGPLLIPVA